MSTNPVALPVSVTDQLNKAVKEAISPEEIRAAVLAEAERQAAEKQTTDETVAAETAKKQQEAVEAAANQSFSRTVTIGGREFEFVDRSELDLERQITNALLVANALAPQAAAKTEPVAPVVQGPTEEEKAASRADLELKFKRGEIDTATYLEQSGAVDDFLAKKGIPVEALRKTVEQAQSTQFEQSWAEATSSFLNSAAGADWPGGDRNKTIIGMKIAELGLTDSKDKVAALAQAYSAMKSQGLVFAADAAVATPAAAAAPAATVTRTAAAAPAAAAPAAPAKVATSSSLFGASSGVGAQVLTNADKNEPKFDIPANATPAEIIDAWKKQMIAQGKDPNAAFTDAFKR